MAQATPPDRHASFSGDIHKWQVLHRRACRCRKGVERRLYGCYFEPYPVGRIRCVTGGLFTPLFGDFSRLSIHPTTGAALEFAARGALF
jgi:hypothetical protein